jgi:hypothetical protein
MRRLQEQQQQLEGALWANQQQQQQQQQQQHSGLLQHAVSEPLPNFFDMPLSPMPPPPMSRAAVTPRASSSPAPANVFAMVRAVETLNPKP